MIGSYTDIFSQILRVSICVAIAAVVAAFILKRAHIKPSIHVYAWMLVLLPGWLLFSFSIELPWHVSNTANAPTSPFNLIDLLASADRPTSEMAGNISESPAVLPDHFAFSFLLFWVLGMIAIAIWDTYHYLLLKSVLKTTTNCDDPTWIDELNIAKQSTRLQQTPQLLVSQSFGPAACYRDGKASIIVPANFWEQCNSSTRIAILHHELAHIERNDLWRTLLARLLFIPQWFNPVAWFALRRFSESTEVACDDHAISQYKSGRIEYAKALLSMIEFGHNNAASRPNAIAASGSPIQRRVQRIIQPKGIEMKFSKTLTLVVLATISLFAFLRFDLVAQDSAKPGTVQTPTPRLAKVDAVSSVVAKPTVKSDRSETLCTEAYYVGDILVFIVEEEAKKKVRDGITLKDFTPITDILKNSIAADDTNFTVQPFPPKLSVIVSGTQKQHGQVRDMLTKLRELQAVTIELKMQFIVVKPGHRIESTKSISQPMSAEAYDRLCKTLSKGSIASLEVPSKIIYNGQSSNIKSDSMAKAGLTPANITVTTNSYVNGIGLACSPVPKLTEENSIEVTLAKQGPNGVEEFTRRRLKDPSVLRKKSVLIEINQKGLGIMDVSGLLKKSAANRKAFLLVYPKIIDRRDEILKPGDKPTAKH